ncbi:MAG: hypothetical protein CM15mP116_08440 [Synechococcus sp.]|nr:MAG: hypothetical protein CM15mP116_08440 [Synechococcus sp.]
MEEFSRPALALIRDTLSSLNGLNRLVIALAAESAEDVAHAEAFFAGCLSRFRCTGPMAQR